MLRAGHQYEHVKVILAAVQIEDVEEWVAAAFEVAADEEGTDEQW